MKIKNTFYKNVAFGFSICFIFQVFLNIGGVTKFIPSTGVTLPLVSYGVSSVISTMIIFAVIQGICVLENSGVVNNDGYKKTKVRETGSKRDEFAGE
jgi:cell division protein FtsW (lipid II flippase)